MERAWAELLVNADDELVPYLAVMSGVESLHRMTREERDLDGLIVPGSDHLTAYNVYAEAFEVAGYIGEVYGLPRHLFDEEEIDRVGGAARRAREGDRGRGARRWRACTAALDMPLPAHMPMANEGDAPRSSRELLAAVHAVRSRDRRGDGVGRGGARLEDERVRQLGRDRRRAALFRRQVRHARARRSRGRSSRWISCAATRTGDDATLEYDAERRKAPLVLKRRVEYFGFELEREIEAVDEFPPGREDEARTVLADALARGEARHFAVRTTSRTSMPCARRIAARAARCRA